MTASLSDLANRIVAGGNIIENLERWAAEVVESEAKGRKKGA